MLLKEYALDPAILCSRTNCQILLPQIGASQGRLIARFPKDWKKRAYEAARKTAKPTELSWIEEKLRRIGEFALFACGRPGGDSSLPWVESALAEHKRKPFTAVLGAMTQAGVLTLDDLDDAQPPWLSQRQCEVPRHAKAMADAISLLFLSGTRFKFIDPHLDPSKSRFRNPLVEFLGRIAARSNGMGSVRVECHVMTSGNTEQEQSFARNFEKSIAKHLPTSLTLSLHFHPASKMHDRYVLTQWAGADFGQGLDEGDEPPMVKVSLLDEQIRATKWDEYDSDHPALVLPKP